MVGVSRGSALDVGASSAPACCSCPRSPCSRSGRLRCWRGARSCCAPSRSSWPSVRSGCAIPSPHGLARWW